MPATRSWTAGWSRSPTNWLPRSPGASSEHTATVAELAAVPVDDVPDAAAWQVRLDFEQALVDYWTAVASALAGGDPATARPQIQTVVDVPIDTDPLSTLFLNQRDCQLLYSQADPVPGGGIAPVTASCYP